MWLPSCTAQKCLFWADQLTSGLLLPSMMPACAPGMDACCRRKPKHGAGRWRRSHDAATWPVMLLPPSRVVRCLLSLARHCCSGTSPGMPLVEVMVSNRLFYEVLHDY